MIEIYSFEEWDAVQDPNSILEWGSTGQEKTSKVEQHSSRYADAPLAIREMFYAEYVHALTTALRTPNTKL